MLPVISFMGFVPRDVGFIVSYVDTTENQSIETAGVAFVKGLSERHELSEKINKQ